MASAANHFSSIYLFCDTKNVLTDFEPPVDRIFLECLDEDKCGSKLALPLLAKETIKLQTLQKASYSLSVFF